MKISHRIILVNLIIVAIVLGSAAIAFYSIMYNTLTSQQSQNLINSTRNFVFTFRSLIDDTNEEFLSLKDKKNELMFRSPVFAGTLNDFFLEASPQNEKEIIRYAAKSIVNIPQHFTIEEFTKLNPYARIESYIDNTGSILYYGKIISGETLNNLAQRIGSDIALIWDNFTVEVTNPSVNLQYSILLTKAYKALKQKSDFEVFSSEGENTDLIATVVKLDEQQRVGNNLAFLIFKSHNEASDLRSTLRNILILIGFVGIILALILSYVLTHRLRIRIAELSDATAKTSAGNFKTRMQVNSNDEIGKLSEAFNIMLDELEKNQKAKNEYSDFITMINQSASLNEIANAALVKIINTCGFLIGALYLVEGDKTKLICAYGVSDVDQSKERDQLYKRIILTKEPIEINDNTSLPILKTGVAEVKINYLYVLPVIYSNKVIAILELASTGKPTDEAKEYLSKIQEQLAIGLTNANALAQLENFVNELKTLNEEYQKQNLQIKKQNEILVDLSNELKQKAEELAIQKERAEESTMLKSQFLASMSHELRTPMNSILGLTELILEKSALTGKNKERLEVVLNSGKRLMSLINDILDLSKIEAGKMEIKEEEVLLEEIIEEVSATIKPLAYEKNLDFNILRKCNTRVIVSTDKGRIAQILINLLGNAIKFTHSGKTELTVSFTQDKWLKFSVSDTGIGISKDHQKLIFEEFRQIDGSASRKYGGTGLGLAISKKIIDLMGGKIWVDSDEGLGSTFTFAVPVNQTTSENQKSKAAINTEALRKNINNPILIIDSNSESRSELNIFLKSNGYDVILAEDGKSGISIAKEKQPFIIALDVVLHDQDGWSVLKELKSDPATKDIPVIIMSIIGDKNISRGQGAFEYFLKPISYNRFIGILKQLELLAKHPINKILLVDDDELEFEKLKREFSNYDVVLDFIQDSETAFDKIIVNTPDLIILDLIMPKYDGTSLLQQLKSDSRTRHIPVIIGTAKNITEEEKSLLSSLADSIVIKGEEHLKQILNFIKDRIFKRQYEEKKNYSDFGTDKDNAVNYIEFEDSHEYLGEVLIVDDDADTLFTINEMVLAAGCKTYTANSGIECLNLLKKYKPDLILLDIMMPEMDGFQVLKNIRSIQEFTDIPVYAVTARAMTGDKEVILRQGFNDYISKPVNSKTLIKKIKQFFTNIKTV